MNFRKKSIFFLFSLSLVFTSSSALTQTQNHPKFKRVLIFVFENANYKSALKQPYFSLLSKRGALLSSHQAVAHPSQPNYIALIAGDTLGVQNDKNVNLQEKHLGSLLNDHGLDWKVYAEDLPMPCYLGESKNKYARKHVPFLSFTSVQKNPSECAKIVNSNQFQTDYYSSQLPAVSLYIPNLDHDGHDTGVSYASEWFKNNFQTLLQDQNFLKDTLVVITFDESEVLSFNNQIYTVLLGANTIPNSIISAKTNHYSILRMIEDQFLIGNLGKNDLTAPEIKGAFQ